MKAANLYNDLGFWNSLSTEELFRGQIDVFIEEYDEKVPFGSSKRTNEPTHYDTCDISLVCRIQDDNSSIIVMKVKEKEYIINRLVRMIPEIWNFESESKFHILGEQYSLFFQSRNLEHTKVFFDSLSTVICIFYIEDKSLNIPTTFNLGKLASELIAYVNDHKIYSTPAMSRLEKFCSTLLEISTLANRMKQDNLGVAKEDAEEIIEKSQIEKIPPNRDLELLKRLANKLFTRQDILDIRNRKSPEPLSESSDSDDSASNFQKLLSLSIERGDTRYDNPKRLVASKTIDSRDDFYKTKANASGSSLNTINIHERGTHVHMDRNMSDNSDNSSSNDSEAESASENNDSLEGSSQSMNHETYSINMTSNLDEIISNQYEQDNLSRKVNLYCDYVRQYLAEEACGGSPVQFNTDLQQMMNTLSTTSIGPPFDVKAPFSRNLASDFKNEDDQHSMRGFNIMNDDINDSKRDINIVNIETINESDQEEAITKTLESISNFFETDPSDNDDCSNTNQNTPGTPRTPNPAKYSMNSMNSMNPSSTHETQLTSSFSSSFSLLHDDMKTPPRFWHHPEKEKEVDVEENTFYAKDQRLSRTSIWSRRDSNYSHDVDALERKRFPDCVCDSSNMSSSTMPLLSTSASGIAVTFDQDTGRLLCYPLSSVSSLTSVSSNNHEWEPSTSTTTTSSVAAAAHDEPLSDVNDPKNEAQAESDTKIVVEVDQIHIKSNITNSYLVFVVLCVLLLMLRIIGVGKEEEIGVVSNGSIYRLWSDYIINQWSWNGNVSSLKPVNLKCHRNCESQSSISEESLTASSSTFSTSIAQHDDNDSLNSLASRRRERVFPRHWIELTHHCYPHSQIYRHPSTSFLSNLPSAAELDALSFDEILFEQGYYSMQEEDEEEGEDEGEEGEGDEVEAQKRDVKDSIVTDQRIRSLINSSKKKKKEASITSSMKVLLWGGMRKMFSILTWMDPSHEMEIFGKESTNDDNHRVDGKHNSL